jgi:hypothetical protein
VEYIKDAGEGMRVLRYRFSGTRNSVVRDAKWRRRAWAGSFSEKFFQQGTGSKMEYVTHAPPRLI